MSPKHHLCSAWCIHIAPCLVKKVKLYGRFLYFGLCSPVSNLWNICLINTSIFWWTNFWELDRNIQGQNIVCFTQWEAKTVIPPWHPEVPRMLKANTAFSSEGILGGEPASSLEKKDEGNISERGCAKKSQWESFGIGEGHETGPG